MRISSMFLFAFCLLQDFRKCWLSKTFRNNSNLERATWQFRLSSIISMNTYICKCSKALVNLLDLWTENRTTATKMYRGGENLSRSLPNLCMTRGGFASPTWSVKTHKRKSLICSRAATLSSSSKRRVLRFWWTILYNTILWAATETTA